MVDLIFKWQTFLAVFLSGFFSLLTALLVAFAARRRDENIAATLLYRILIVFLGAFEEIDKVYENKDLDEGKKSDRTLWILWKLPELSEQFSTSLARVIYVDSQLAAHLTLFELRYNTVMRMRVEIKNKTKEPNELEDRKIVKSMMMKEELREELKYAKKYADCSEYLLDKLFLRTFANFNRIFRPVCLFCTRRDIKCSEILKNPDN